MIEIKKQPMQGLSIILYYVCFYLRVNKDEYISTEDPIAVPNLLRMGMAWVAGRAHNYLARIGLQQANQNQLFNLYTLIRSYDNKDNKLLL